MDKETPKIIKLTEEQAKGLVDVDLPTPVNPRIIMVCRRLIWEETFNFNKLRGRTKALMGASTNTIAHADMSHRWMEGNYAGTRN